VRTLTGWTTTASGRLVTFSLMLSSVRDMSIAQAAMDKAVLAWRQTNL
jgi:D-alanyl-D-alanine carboxypeptidase